MIGLENAPQMPWTLEPRSPEYLDFQTLYMSRAHRPDSLVDYAKLYLADVEYDTLVGTGLSGTLAVVELARQLEKEFLIVRKRGENSHASSPVEGMLGKRWVFVDDLVDTGATFARVWDAVDKAATGRKFDTTYVGAFLYNFSNFVPADSERTEEWLKSGGSKRWNRPEDLGPVKIDLGSPAPLRDAYEALYNVLPPLESIPLTVVPA